VCACENRPVSVKFLFPAADILETNTHRYELVVVVVIVAAAAAVAAAATITVERMFQSAVSCLMQFISSFKFYFLK
jgi:hypothetical protein